MGEILRVHLGILRSAMTLSRLGRARHGFGQFSNLLFYRALRFVFERVFAGPCRHLTPYLFPLRIRREAC